MKKFIKKTMVLLSMVTMISVNTISISANGTIDDPYKDNKELQEIFDVYEKNSGNGMLLAPNPMAIEDINVDVVKGGDFEVQLEENPSTGYTWHVTIDDEKIINLISDRENADNNQLVGVPGKHIYNFDVLKNGETKITFQLYREWESEKIAETKTFVVRVSDKGEEEVIINLTDFNENDTDIQDIIQVYEENRDTDMLLAPNPMANEKVEKATIFQTFISAISNFFNRFF